MTMPAEPAKRDNVFTRKIGPIPMWGWVAIVAVLLFAWRWYSSKHAASQQAAAQQASTANASQVPQFVNQTYTTVQAPSAPNMPTPAPPPTPRGNHGPGPRPAPPTSATMRGMGINNFGNLLQWASKSGYTANATLNGQPVSSSTTNNPAFWHYPVDSVTTSGNVITAQISQH